MPRKNVSHTFCFVAWDTANNAGKTGDAANITLRGVGDGSEYTPSAPNITEVDSSNLPGVYKATVSASENNYASVLVGGKSSTANIVIQPVQWTNEVSADLARILGTALTESSSGYLAAAFKVLFDVAAPVLTAASVNQTGDSYARIGATGSGLTSLLAAGSYTAPDNADIVAIKTLVDAALDATISSRMAAGATVDANLVQVNGGSTGSTAGILNLKGVVIQDNDDPNHELILIGHPSARPSDYAAIVIYAGGAPTGNFAASPAIYVEGGWAGEDSEQIGGAALMLQGGSAFTAGAKQAAPGLFITSGHSYGNPGQGADAHLYVGDTPVGPLTDNYATNSAAPGILVKTGQYSDPDQDSIILDQNSSGKAIHSKGQIYVAPTTPDADAVTLTPNGTGRSVDATTEAELASALLNLVNGIASGVTPKQAIAAIKTAIDSYLDVAISTRLAALDYTAPANSDIAAIKANTDNLPSDPADASDIATAFGLVQAALSALNNVSAAEVRAQADAALAAYDSPTRAEATADKDEVLAAIPSAVSVADTMGTRQVVEPVSYPAVGVLPTLDELLLMIHGLLATFKFTGTAQSIKRLDNPTVEAMAYEIDDAHTPSEHSRVS